jgi:hypothetical protein
MTTTTYTAGDRVIVNLGDDRASFGVILGEYDGPFGPSYEVHLDTGRTIAARERDMRKEA